MRCLVVAGINGELRGPNTSFLVVIHLAKMMLVYERKLRTQGVGDFQLTPWNNGGYPITGCMKALYGLSTKN